MFTGLVEGLGQVVSVRRDGQGMELSVDLRELDGGVAIGDSVSLSGCCSTVTRISGPRADFHLSKESLARTWFGRLGSGSKLNLERALLPTSRLGGHFVQGHVDAVGTIEKIDRRRDGWDLEVALPQGFERWCVEKGSIALDGISLTIAELRGRRIRLALIPHSVEVTTLHAARVGDPLHLEADVLAKYVERMLGLREDGGLLGRPH
ncbi:MAG: riboflavin synthase [Planctomycetota bacterium]|nr:MAG: riboflavin synthase [Planctomycetota bacterium]